jgi:hypothetical protein
MQVLVKTKDPSFEGNPFLLLSGVRIRIRIKLKGKGRIRFRVKGRIRIWIRIRIKVIPRNTAVERDMKKLI